MAAAPDSAVRADAARTPRPDRPRTALLAGATGLIGHALLPLLHASPHYQHVHVLLRRAATEIAGVRADARSSFHTVNFAHLPTALPAVDDVYIALGTTIKAAGSEAAFRRVDSDFVVDTARAARAAGATRLAVVSALGASAASRVFYNRVKGEMQDGVAQLGFEAVVIAQPSLLIGDRAALGQPTRAGEVWATRVLAPVMWMVPRSVQPIQARTVAAAMLAATLAGVAGVRVLSSAQMQSGAAR
ncbi:MAG: NAD(P)H-binding protein [Burkholderiales bacterium]|nr:NAD(P)H-binding protein [Burkholderiales bacterium]MDE2626759.1 NAD(P)H-binding protein [Burkholderiales bacterium]